MIKSKLFTGVALAGMLLSTSALSPVGPFAVTPAQAQSVSVSFDLFFDELEPHGVWVRHPQYRYVFCPTGVDTSWRPYTRGRWLYLADQGWYFDSDEPFAWATYHYGRWLDDDNLGWCWVPGTKWAPAWVSWRRGGDVVGWAPLPPEGDGFSVSVNVVREDFPQDYWVYVPTRSFIEPNLSVSIVFGSDARDYYTQTEFLGPVEVQGDVVVNNVLEVTYIEQQINQEVTVYNVEQADAPDATTVASDSQTVQVFTADVAEPEEEAAPAEAVEEAEAVEVITSEGGTAGADAEAGAATDPAATDTTETEAEATTEETETPADATGAGEVEAETDAEVDAEVDADAEVQTDTDAEVIAPAEDTTETDETDAAEEQPAEEEPVTTEEETTTEGTEAPVTEEEETTAPADETDATSEEAAPVEEEEAAPAEEEAAPAEEEAAQPDCPPAQLVDGVCQPLADEAPADETSSSEDASTGSAEDAGDSGSEEPAVTQ